MGTAPDHVPAAADLVAQLLDRCTFARGATSLDCAVSGGADSLALLTLATAACSHVTAHHVDHGLRPESGSEAGVVAVAAEQLGARFVAHRVELEAGPNLEARARAARYGIMPDNVATGHTTDDQAETVMLALLRGSAWQGLGGIEPGPTKPLLGLRRIETEALCVAMGFDPVEDPSNHDPAFTRNRVRHELLPLLDDIADRDMAPILARQAELLRAGGAYLDGAASVLDPTDSVSIAAAPLILARQVIRRWLWTAMVVDHPPDLATVDRVIAVARLEARATDVGGGWRVARTDRRLRLEAPMPDESDR